MEIHQLKTFVAVAREGSITRASERLFLSQPAVSAHVKALEDILGVTLFERTVRGMSLTTQGQRILAKAELTLGTHRELMQEATRIKGCLGGRLRLGAGGNSNNELISQLVAELSLRYPEVEVSLLHHTTTMELLGNLRNGQIDAAFYNEANEPASDLAVIEASVFDIYLAAQPGLIPGMAPFNVQALSELPWIFPANSCCGQAAENLFRLHNFRPKRVISVDREAVTRTLLTRGIGVGLLHADTAKEAQRRGEVTLLCPAQKSVRVLFAYMANRVQDPLLSAAGAILQAGLNKVEPPFSAPREIASVVA